MKKNTIKAFTLVEMLIVIVIIGILIAALLPRMQAAQGRARDVARKTALSQVQSAIVTYQGDHGKWPKQDDATTPATAGVGLNTIENELLSAGMTNVPVDPLSSNNVSGLGDSTTTNGNYAYIVAARNGTSNAGFALMAKTEVAGGSNYVYCSDSEKISNDTDLSTVKLCGSLDEGTCSLADCTYETTDQLRYVVLY